MQNPKKFKELVDLFKKTTGKHKQIQPTDLRRASIHKINCINAKAQGILESMHIVDPVRFNQFLDQQGLRQAFDESIDMQKVEEQENISAIDRIIQRNKQIEQKNATMIN